MEYHLQVRRITPLTEGEIAERSKKYGYGHPTDGHPGVIGQDYENHKFTMMVDVIVNSEEYEAIKKAIIAAKV
jgi:hypothetical protein